MLYYPILDVFLSDAPRHIEVVIANARTIENVC